MDPTLTVLSYSAIAALTSALGAIPLAGRDPLPTAWMGWANAVASGLMLGAAYVLVVEGLVAAPLEGAAGAVLGILFIYWTHAVSGTEELDLNRLEAEGPTYEYKVLLVHTLHSASEGIAIGVAMMAGLTLGIFMALAIAVHNIPEATLLAAVLRSRGARLGQAAGLAVVSNVSQVLFAVATFAVISSAPGILPWAVGLAVGALIHLVMVELLPESYRQAGPTGIALVTSVALGMVVLFLGFVMGR